MDFQDTLFLEALKASLKNEKVQWDFEIEQQDWSALFQMADKQQVLPMIYEAVYNCPSAKKTEESFWKPLKMRVIQMVTIQTMKTNEFFLLLENLKKAGVNLCVVKGVICRDLYPNPDYRISGDEDIWIPREQFELCHTILTKYGMVLTDEKQDIDSSYEVSYGKIGSPIYVEIHKELFPSDAEAYGDFNYFFEGGNERRIECLIQGISVPTMNYTDHLFYLICHAFKHFLHSGFGIRQVCDIILFANKYGTQINWIQMLENCKLIHAELFTAALFKIGLKYLTFKPETAHYPKAWSNIQIDETAMLNELLSSGVYGDSSMSRKHSSNITLNVVSAQKQGGKMEKGIIKTLFPSVKKMENRYFYLKKYPFLLPLAWADRIVKYRKEVNESSDNSALESIKIGNERVELMKKYGIIK